MFTYEPTDKQDVLKVFQYGKLVGHILPCSAEPFSPEHPGMYYQSVSTTRKGKVFESLPRLKRHLECPF